MVFVFVQELICLRIVRNIQVEGTVRCYGQCFRFSLYEYIVIWLISYAMFLSRAVWWVADFSSSLHSKPVERQIRLHRELLRYDGSDGSPPSSIPSLQILYSVFTGLAILGIVILAFLPTPPAHLSAVSTGEKPSTIRGRDGQAKNQIIFNSFLQITRSWSYRRSNWCPRRRCCSWQLYVYFINLNSYWHWDVNWTK